jgi:protein tyrosine/serine phosphatase
MQTPRQVALAHFETLFIDGLFLNALLPTNKHRVSKNLWRSGQPHALQFDKLAQQGIRTIINLRGKRDCASYLLEAKACRRHGITLVDFPMDSRQPPRLEILEQIEGLFSGIAYPALLHCKAGSDRAGIMSALYLLIIEKQPVDVAKKQLSLRYGHIRQAKTGVLDRFLEAYQSFSAKRPMAFLDWARQHYDREAVIASHKVFNWAAWLTDRALRRE